MKKLLYLVLVLQIVTGIISFFMLISASFLGALLVAGLDLLSAVPTLAIIFNMKDIEDIQYELSTVRSRLRTVEDRTKSVEDGEVKEEEKGRASFGNWECIKCGTVNKAGTCACQNCKAAYSPVLNPTDNPFEKKKVSRFVKFK